MSCSLCTHKSRALLQCHRDEKVDYEGSTMNEQLHCSKVEPGAHMPECAVPLLGVTPPPPL